MPPRLLLDCLARTAIDGGSAVKELFERGVRVHILNMELTENTLTGNLILTVMLAFAEYERGMIVEPTQIGKTVARQDSNFRGDAKENMLTLSCSMHLNCLKQVKPIAR